MSHSRALALFDELVDADVATREARLRDVAQHDATLADAVRRMLDADADASGVLDHALADAVPAAALPPDRSGQQIDAYRLVARIGRGGMGEVYRAEREGEDYAQTVALKLLRRGVDSEDIVRRFVQERRILARLEHPGIARLIDGGMSADGLPWLAMELVEGEPITHYARTHASSLPGRIDLLLAVCEALDYAHRRLVVHRDLKPSNVLVGSDGAPRLLDFGIAKLLDQPEGETLTGTGVRLLSPAYAAPEQIAGEPVGIATDVYALGLLLYELLTGELPQGRREGGLSALSARLVETPERPSDALRRRQGGDTTVAARSLEGDLDTIVLKALAHEPDRRYASAAALAEDLRRYLDGRPIAARPDTLSYRVGKFVRRHRGGVAVGVLSALGIIAALLVALWQADVARHEAARAVSEAQRAEQAAVLAQESVQRTRRVKQFMMESFVHADPLRSRAGAPRTVEQAVDDALARVDSELGDDPKLQVDLLDDFGEIRSGQGRFDEAQALFDRTLVQAEKLYRPDDPVIAEALMNRASIDIYRGQVAESAPRIERAVAILERHAAQEPLALVNALGALSYIRGQQGQQDEAVTISVRALAIQREHGKPNDPQLRMAVHNVGTNLLHARRLAEAVPYLREAVALGERELGADSPGLDMSLSSLSDTLYRLGETAESQAVDERRVRIVRASAPGPHTWKASALTDAGFNLVQAKRFDEGFVLLEEAIAMYDELRSEDVVPALRYLALGKRTAGDDTAALAAIERAWTHCRDGIEKPYCALIAANRAGMLVRVDRAAEGLQEAEAAAEALARLGLGGNNEMAQCLESKAMALNALGRYAEADAASDEALAIYVKAFGADHPEVERAHRNRKRLLDARPAAAAAAG